MGVPTRVLQSSFEGLFVRALKVDGPTREKLKQKGYDIDQPEPKYPLEVWEDCLTVVAEQLFPGQSKEEAWPRLGKLIVEGFLETIVGRMIGATLPFLSPTTLLKRVPRFLTAGIEGTTATLSWESPRVATIHLTGTGYLAAWMLSGVLLGMFAKLNVTGATVEPRRLNELDCEMHITLPE